jgi:hypothetical protein
MDQGQHKKKSTLCYRHETWQLVPPLDNRKIIGTKWVFKIKDPESMTPRYKARLVTQGFTQIEGIDYTDTSCIRRQNHFTSHFILNRSVSRNADPSI